MSKTISSLNSIEKKKEGKYASAINKDTAGHLHYSQIHNASLIMMGLFLAIILFILLWSNSKLFNKLNSYTLEKYNILAKLNKLEDSLSNNNQLVSDLNLKISKLEKDNDSQTFSLETLTKAKNTLFNRVSLLERKIDNSKTQY